ncbi:hypothetical protein ISF6_4100 [Piscinibacter sakaiensis]|uniref:Transmembrane protein n=2 Tax=Piscinibacter sakaiensis TaxID=1547922 RepID=A0A0K8P5N1_PISS1|nr:hypothetical protein ISF6_4100 [Piscinibacter sakaiensis]
MPRPDADHWRQAVEQRLDEGAAKMAQLAEQGERHQRGQVEILRRQDELAAALAAQAKAIEANTEITEQIRDMWKAGTWGHKAIIWIGGLAGGLAGMVGLWAAVRSLFRDGAA